MDKKRHNIGLLVANVMDPFSNGVVKGAMLAAERNDCNLFIVPGKYIDLDFDSRESDTKYEYQYNALFSFVSAHNLDYLIVCVGTIAYMSSTQRKKEFLSQFNGTPVLSVAAKIDGYDYVQYDNISGISQAVDYLADKMHRKHICMMVGNLNNNECVERFEAYRNGLLKHNLTFCENQIMESDISSNCYKEAELLLDRNPECDAIMCVNDDIAFTFYEILHKRNIRIGKDISVVGFDNLPYVENLEPHLSSIRADAEKLGSFSIEKAVNFLNGKEDDRHLLPTTFVPRQSCFGTSENNLTAENVFIGSTNEISKKILAYVFDDNLSVSYCSDTRKNLVELLKYIYTEFTSKQLNNTLYDEMCDYINLYLTNNHHAAERASKIVEIADSGYDYFKKIVTLENKPYLTSLHSFVLKKIVYELIVNTKTLNDEFHERQHLSNLVIRDTLMFESDIKNSYSAILKKLHYIGVDTSYLFILSQPVVYHNHDVFPENVQWYFKSYQYGDETYTAPDNNQKLTTSQLFSSDKLPYDRRFTVCLVDLFSNEMQYGLALCELRSSKYLEYIEILTYQLSASVKIIQLLNQQEKMLTELHESNLVLENVSKIDELTGTYNRRGFYYVANKLITKPENRFQKYVVCYADMDNLKHVNDNYGHIEGDYAIKALADCLSELYLDCGVIGRMGGDEFAVIALSKNVGTIQELQKRKDMLIEKLNQHAEKPYYINMSVGFYECMCDNSYDFKDAIDKADDLLYKAKRQRKQRKTDL